MELIVFSSRVKTLVLLMTVAAVSLVTRPAAAIYIRHDVALANYVALASDPLYAATGYLRSPNGQFCTGTLVSPTIVLSAAHCFVYTGGPKAGTVALPGDLMFGAGDAVAPFSSNVAALQLNPNYDITNFAPEYDMALVTLSSPFAGITPARLWGGDPFGLTATIVGYGTQGTGVSHGLPGAGPRLAAQNVVDLVGSGSLRIDFDSPNLNANRTGSAFPLPLEGTPATGDSGGPLFVLLDGLPFIAGTLHGGIGSNLYGDISLYSRGAREENLAFLRANGIDLATPVPEPATFGLLSASLLAGWAARRRQRRTR